MKYLSTLKVKLAILATAMLAFIAARLHYIRTGERRSDAKHAEQDKKNAVRVAVTAQEARDRADADVRSPTERVRSLGGLRDG